jgi:hypothetical protein
MDPRTGLGRFRDFRISNYELMMALIGWWCSTFATRRSSTPANRFLLVTDSWPAGDRGASGIRLAWARRRWIIDVSDEPYREVLDHRRKTA